MFRLIKEKDIPWELLMRVLSGELSEDDPEFVMWLCEDDENPDLFRSLTDLQSQDAGLFDSEGMYKEIEKVLFRKKRFFSYYWLKYVAVAILLIASSAFIFFYSSRTDQVQTTAQSLDNPVVDSKMARLKLADGSFIELSEGFQVTREDGTVISNATTGSLVLNAGSAKAVQPEYHTIEVPIGGEYELQLSDGTHVYINSGSSLYFPSFFNEDTRHVKLTGEAYFEVKKDKDGKPFVVDVNDAAIWVFGTSFNVSAYKENKGIDATLVSGNIKMKITDNGEGYQVYPGQNLHYNRNNQSVNIENVDTDIYTAWMRGEFVFNNKRLEDIMNQLSRWYDFEIQYQDESLKNLRFTGAAKKTRSLDYVIYQIESVINIKFNADGNMVTVKNR